MRELRTFRSSNLWKKKVSLLDEITLRIKKAEKLVEYAEKDG